MSKEPGVGNLPLQVPGVLPGGMVTARIDSCITAPNLFVDAGQPIKLLTKNV